MYFSKIAAVPVVRNWAFAFPLFVVLVFLCTVSMAQNAQPNAVASTPSAQTILARGPAGVVVSSNDVLAELQKAPEATRQVVLSQPDSVQQIVNNILIRRMLAAEAERDGLANDSVLLATVAIARDRALSDARLARLDAQNVPNDVALDAYAKGAYQASGNKYEKPAQTRARHILLPNTGAESLQKAKALLAQLRAGASFEELAKTNSTDPGSAARGGDLGFFAVGQMVRPFDDAVNALVKAGDLSEPVESQFGYHIIRLEERRPKGRPPYEEVRAQLLAEARTAILNEARILKVQSMNKDFVIDKAAIETFTKPATR